MRFDLWTQAQISDLAIRLAQVGIRELARSLYCELIRYQLR